MRKLIHCGAVIAAIVAGSFGRLAWASPFDLGPSFTEAVKLDSTGKKRTGDARRFIVDLQKRKILARRPNTREDFSDFYRVKSEATLLGSSVVIIVHEYLDDSPGCCASPGLEVVLRTDTQSKELADFARKHSCTLTEGYEPKKALGIHGVTDTLDGNHFAHLRCLERDLPEE